MIRAPAAILRGLPRRADSPASFLAFFGRRRLGGSIAPSAVDAIASAIQTQEGYYPGSLAYRNNNPGNLVYVGQPGATQGAGGFASFSSYDAGLQALKNQIALDASRGSDAAGRPVVTVSDLITSWAPPSENDTAAYIASVSLQTGFDPSAPLSSLGAGVVLTPPADSGAPPPAVDSSFPAAIENDVSGFLSSNADLSAVGGPSSVPVPLLVGGGLVGLLALSRLF